MAKIEIGPVVEALTKVPDALAQISRILETSEDILRKVRAWIMRLQNVFQVDVPEEIARVNMGLIDKSSVLDGLIGHLHNVLGEAAELPEVEAIAPEIEALEHAVEDAAMQAAEPRVEPVVEPAPESEGNLLDQYNQVARDFNDGLNESQKHELHALKDGLLTEALDAAEDVDFDSAKQKAAEQIELMFSDEEKAEIQAFADELWEELFPETNVSQLGKWLSGREELADYQEVLLAPANGIEGVVTGLFDLITHPVRSYEDISGAVKMLSGMSYEDYCNCARVLKLMYAHMDKKDMIAPAISFIVGLAFISGGAGALNKFSKGSKVPACLARITGTAARATHSSGSLARAKEMPTRMLEEIDYVHVLEELQEEIQSE